METPFDSKPPFDEDNLSLAISIAWRSPPLEEPLNRYYLRHITARLVLEDEEGVEQKCVGTIEAVRVREDLALDDREYSGLFEYDRESAELLACWCAIHGMPLNSTLAECEAHEEDGSARVVDLQGTMNADDGSAVLALLSIEADAGFDAYRLEFIKGVIREVTGGEELVVAYVEEDELKQNDFTLLGFAPFKKTPQWQWFCTENRFRCDPAPDERVAFNERN